MLRRALNWALGLALLAGAVALVRDTRYQGQDFEVFWRTARYVLAGQPVYDVARDGAMVFKYPPWIVPLFFPLAAFSLESAKWLWGFGQVLCVLWTIIWLRRQGCRFPVVGTVLLGFWGILAVHALDGQVGLAMLALSLWAWPFERVRAYSVAALALSTKVTTALSLAGELTSCRRLGLCLRAGVVSLLVAGLLSTPACWTAPDRTPVGLFRGWSEAAMSGGTAFGGNKVRGRDNQGFPALILRAAGVPGERAFWDVGLAVLLALVLGLTWFRLSTGLTPAERWAGWLALGAVTHPLAWFHLFVLVFPLAVFSVQRSWSRGRRLALSLSVLGVAFIGAATAKSLGQVGLRLELLSIKSWGTVICAAALIAASSQSAGRARP